MSELLKEAGDKVEEAYLALRGGEASVQTAQDRHDYTRLVELCESVVNFDKVEALGEWDSEDEEDNDPYCPNYNK